MACSSPPLAKNSESHCFQWLRKEPGKAFQALDAGGREGGGAQVGAAPPGNAGRKVGPRRARKERDLPQVSSPPGWVVRSALTRLADLTFACFALPGVATRCQAHNTISTSVQLTLAARLTTAPLSVNTEFEC